VISVLLAASGIAAYGLDVAIGRRTNPDIAPRGWNRERLDAVERPGITDLTASRPEIHDAGPGPPTTNAGILIGDVPECAHRADDLQWSGHMRCKTARERAQSR